jgi:YVTN family beta-propeller protein
MDRAGVARYHARSSPTPAAEEASMRKRTGFLLVTACLVGLPWLLHGQAGGTAEKSRPAGPRLRRPIALALADGGQTLLVANRDSGTVAVLDTRRLQVIGETRLGRKLADLAATRDGNLVLLADEQAGEVILVARRQGVLREVGRRKVGLSPVSVQVGDDGRLATVACLWPRRLVLLDLAAGPNARPVFLDLPFAPRRQLLVPGTSRLIVADAFGGDLAVVNLRRRKVESVRRLAGHNLGGLALDRRHGLLLTHQTLNGGGRTTRADIRNSNLITNDVHRLPLADVLNPSADPLQGGRLYPLGDVERGAGDPAAVAEADDGRMLITLAGTDELAVGRPDQATWTRLAVGCRPTAVAVDTAARRVYVANTFGDSVSVVDLRVPKVIAEVRLGPPAELRPEERGELLFYDARLSHDAWFSCHSCHPDGHSNGLLNDNFTDGSFGTPKRVLSLLGVRDTGPWAWGGQMPNLEAQVRNSLTSTLQGPPPSDRQVRDLTAFLRTLPPPPSLLTARGQIDPAAVKRGRRVFARQKCGTCHTPPTYTSPQAYDVGLRDEASGSRFNPPSLRGLSQAGPYFHDNRAGTLEEVFTRYRHELAGQLSDQELADLLHFLRSL